jgi:hypothetical protein
MIMQAEGGTHQSPNLLYIYFRLLGLLEQCPNDFIVDFSCGLYFLLWINFCHVLIHGTTDSNGSHVLSVVWRFHEFSSPYCKNCIILHRAPCGHLILPFAVNPSYVFLKLLSLI